MKGLFYAILIFSSTFAFTVSGLSAQVTKISEDIGKTYKIANEDYFQNLDEYISALNKASFEDYRLKSKRFLMNFENGLQVEVFSAEELLKNGLLKNTNDYPSEIQKTVAAYKLNGKEIIGTTIDKGIYDKTSSEVFYIINDKPVSRDEYMKYLSENEKK